VLGFHLAFTAELPPPPPKPLKPKTEKRRRGRGAAADEAASDDEDEAPAESVVTDAVSDEDAEAADDTADAPVTRLGRRTVGIHRGC